MIHLPTAPFAHIAFDLAAWASASLVAWRQHRAWPQGTQTLLRLTAPGYYRWLAVGALIGAWLAGTLNTLRLTALPLHWAPSHSVAGALAGGIAAVELWKWRHGVRGSTGGSFVLPMATGIMVGRLGCLFAGLPDLTYGTPTTLPWAVDLGDGTGRHPVQLYESAAMALFIAVFVVARRRGAGWARHHAFHAFAIWYGAQRFVWEFFKPYPNLVGPFNLFHLICGGLVVYGIVYWRNDARRGAQGGALCVSQPDDEPVRNLP